MAPDLRRKSKHREENEESPPKELEAPARRRSIHREENVEDSSPPKYEMVVKCQQCRQHILYNEETKVQATLSKKDLEKWKKIKDKTEIYPDVTDVPFTCEKCGDIKAAGIENMQVPASSGLVAAFAAPLAPAVVSAGAAATSVTAGPLGIMVLAGMILAAGITSFIGSSQEEDYYNPASFDVNVNQSAKEEMLDNKIYDLENKYTKQVEEVWDTLAAGVKSVLKSKPNRPSVFLMLYESNSAGDTARCIAKDTSDIAIDFLMNRKLSPVVVNGNDLNTAKLEDDPGQLLVMYNSTVRRQGAMIVTDLQDVSAKVATSFHFFCDKYTPLIETAVYFFTLNVDTKLPRKKLGEVAMKRLTALWQDKMEDFKMNPLITRLTGNVIKISSDSTSC